MNKLLPLGVITSLLLTGCGGSSGGGGGGSTPVPAPKYTWQIIHLSEEALNDVGAQCVIYSEVPTEQTLENDDSIRKVMTAFIATEGYKILIHDKDGIVQGQFEPKSTNSNQFIIDTGLVPEGGYVTLEESLDFTPNPPVQMLSIQRELLQDLTLNVTVPSEANQKSCHKGLQQVVEDYSNNAINVVSSNSEYHQTSYINKAVTGQVDRMNIPVLAPKNGKPVLVTVFDEYKLDTNGSRFSGAFEYAILDSIFIFDKEIAQNPPAGTVSSINERFNITVGTEQLRNDAISSVDVAIDGGIYQWQPIYNMADELSFEPSESRIQNWALNLKTKLDNDWQGNSIYAVIDGSGIKLTPYNLDDFSATTTDGSKLDMAIQIDSQFDIQRTLLETKTSNDKEFKQTVFSQPNADQVFMQSSYNITVDAQNHTTDIEVVFVDVNKEEKSNISYFMNQSFDANNYRDQINTGHAVFPDFYDANGIVLTNDEESKGYQYLMSETYNSAQNKVRLN